MTREIFPASMATDHKAFLQHFYKVVDALDDEAVANAFTENGTFILGTRKATGRKEITAFLASLRQTAKSRTHQLDQFFLAPGSDEVMMKRSVEYDLVQGGNVGTLWAGWMRLVRGEGDAVV